MAMDREEDIIILVLGPTGVGKSTFINAAAGRAVASVSHDLQSCTRKVQHIVVPYSGDPTRRVVFVDTPGFGDILEDDAETLKDVGDWLARSYDDGMKLSGIIYLHEISQTSFETSRKSLELSKKLCGDETLKNVILTTTKWGEIPADVGRQREKELGDTYWKKMVAQGSKMARFMDTQESAWAIVDLIVNKDPVDVLDQQDLVDLLNILETESGETLRYMLLERNGSVAAGRE